MVESVFRLGDRFAGSIMTPHTEIDWLDLDDPMQVNLAKIKEKKHAFFPAAHATLDHVVGILRSRDLLLCDCELEKVELEPLLIKPLFIPESMPALQVLEEIRRSEIHLALVIDEYGGILGLVTLFDLLESIVGDITGSARPEEALIIQRSDGSCLVDGTLSIDEFMDYFEIEQLPENFFDGYQTLAGFVLSQLGEIPTTGQTFSWSGLLFEIVDMDKRRVDKVLITRQREKDAVETT